MMRDTQTSGLPVLDPSGRILGSFSPGDLRAMMAEHFGALALPVGEFLALEHGTEWWGESRGQQRMAADLRLWMLLNLSEIICWSLSYLRF